MPLRLESFYRCLALTFILFSVSNANYNNKYENIEYIKLKKTSTEKKLGSKAWWQTASFYQIYPRSFKDTNNDGVGDLRGIAEKLPYLKEIGIAATWLSPIFTSPMADFGYDISNITEIDPLFGTMQDFEDLIAKSKEVGVKIILDFVPNHTISTRPNRTMQSINNLTNTKDSLH
ncbi:maltase A3-like [Teleopsis dalmanni]|uniref:maltase A3-like n=1 Tax=Teleopsis dalmanni TaxID=139649 RepID=UPI0018CE51CE|nr:maltase A3-like [Teleopsis dalmanni]